MDNGELELGKKVQSLRKAKELTIRGLSAKTGITASMISQIENNQVNPSINSLKSIASALDTPLYKFFKIDNPNENLVVRGDSRQFLGRMNSDTIYELLTPDTKGEIDFMLIKLPPTKTTSNEPSNHDKEEVAYVSSGEVTIELESASYVLYKGDSIRIPPNTPHKWLNNSNENVEIISAITNEN